MAQPWDLASDIKWMVLNPTDTLKIVTAALLFTTLLTIGCLTLRQISNLA